MQACCTICGTMKRMPWVPFIFSQHLKKDDDRVLIDEDGLVALKSKTAKIPSHNDSKLTIDTCRDGKGGVTLGINSLSNDIEE